MCLVFARLVVFIGLQSVGAVTAGETGPVTVDAMTRDLNLGAATGVIVDPPGRLRLADVRGRGFSAAPLGAGEALNLGYGTGTAWFRVVLNVAPSAPLDWFLEIGYPSLDRVDLFLVGQAGVTAQQAGDRKSHRRHALSAPQSALSLAPDTRRQP